MSVSGPSGERSNAHRKYLESASPKLNILQKTGWRTDTSGSPRNVLQSPPPPRSALSKSRNEDADAQRLRRELEIACVRIASLEHALTNAVVAAHTNSCKLFSSESVQTDFFSVFEPRDAKFLKKQNSEDKFAQTLELLPAYIHNEENLSGVHREAKAVQTNPPKCGTVFTQTDLKYKEQVFSSSTCQTDETSSLERGIQTDFCGRDCASVAVQVVVLDDDDENLSSARSSSTASSIDMSELVREIDRSELRKEFSRDDAVPLEQEVRDSHDLPRLGSDSRKQDFAESSAANESRMGITQNDVILSEGVKEPVTLKGEMLQYVREHARRNGLTAKLLLDTVAWAMHGCPVMCVSASMRKPYPAYMVLNDAKERIVVCLRDGLSYPNRDSPMQTVLIPDVQEVCLGQYSAGFRRLIGKERKRVSVLRQFWHRLNVGSMDTGERANTEGAEEELKAQEKYKEKENLSMTIVTKRGHIDVIMEKSEDFEMWTLFLQKHTKKRIGWGFSGESKLSRKAMGQQEEEKLWKESIQDICTDTKEKLTDQEVSLLVDMRMPADQYISTKRLLLSNESVFVSLFDVRAFSKQWNILHGLKIMDLWMEKNWVLKFETYIVDHAPLKRRNTMRRRNTTAQLAGRSFRFASDSRPSGVVQFDLPRTGSIVAKEDVARTSSAGELDLRGKGRVPD